LALRSGELAADVVHAALDERDYSAARFADYGAQMCRGIESMRRLVYTFYDEAFSFGVFVKQCPHLVGDLTDCLMGRPSANFDPLFEAVSQFAGVPAPLSHGKPLLEAR
ncbi:MAG: alkylhalidase, partial [Bryobacteraceae bacterium]